MLNFKLSADLFNQLVSDLDKAPTMIRPAQDKGHHQKIVAAFYAKGLKTFRSIKLLCSNKFAEDAITLARSLFETLIHLLYMRQDPIPRTKLFMEYEHIAFKKMFDNLKKGADAGHSWEQEALSFLTPDDIKRINDNYNLVKANYKKNKEWSGGTLKDMVTSLKLDWDYEIAYRDLSTLAHPSPLGITKYIKITPTAMYHGFDSSKEDINKAWTLACLAFFRIMEVYNEVFALGFENRLAEINKVLPS